MSAVEFALVMPMFALLLFGLLDVGRLVYVNNAIAEGAREATRWGSVQGRSRTETTRGTIRSEALRVMTAVPNAAVTVKCEDNGRAATTCSTNDTLIVRVATQVEMTTPLIGQLIGPVQVVAQSTVAVLQ